MSTILDHLSHSFLVQSTLDLIYKKSMLRIIISDIITTFSCISFLEMFRIIFFFQVDKAVGVDPLLLPCKETFMVGINFFFF